MTTQAISDITRNTAKCGGIVTSNGNAFVSARGVCWNTVPNPTVENDHTNDGVGIGDYISSIDNLSPNTTYYIRAYATNSVGTAYGEELSFTTRPLPFDENGASSALFSVAENRQVHFSRGNLQFQASTNTWQFAEHQFDCVGEGNRQISDTNSGWIDLIAWGTSGWNSGANKFQPWESGFYDDFYPGGDYTNSLTGEYANADWGVYNAISNGGNIAGMWRTMTYDEYYYLFYNCTDASEKYSLATIDGQYCGMVLLPDNWEQPVGITFLPNRSYYDNQYSLEQWSEMENNGAFFSLQRGY